MGIVGVVVLCVASTALLTSLFFSTCKDSCKDLWNNRLVVRVPLGVHEKYCCKLMLNILLGFTLYVSL